MSTIKGPIGDKEDISKLKIIDASSAHRTHFGWVYGFPELLQNQALQIKNSNRISLFVHESSSV